jgi:hypothetical protein
MLEINAVMDVRKAGEVAKWGAMTVIFRNHIQDGSSTSRSRPPHKDFSIAENNRFMKIQRLLCPYCFATTHSRNNEYLGGPEVRCGFIYDGNF